MGDLRFSPAEKPFLNSIREDIASRPEFYREGVEYLANHFSPTRLHAADMLTWQHDREIGLDQSYRPYLAKIAREFVEPDDEPDEQDRIERAFYASLIRPPSLCEYSIAKCLGAAWKNLLSEGIETGDEDLRPVDVPRAKAVVTLTWLLTDPASDKHPLGAPFGPWDGKANNEEFLNRIRSARRGFARTGTLDNDEGGREAWMTLAKVAFDALRTSTGEADQGNTVAGLDDDGMYTHRILAERCHEDAEALRKRLSRWKEQNPHEAGRGFVVNQDRRAGQPETLYRLGSVRHLLTT